MSVLPLLLRPSALEQVLQYVSIEYLVVGGGGTGGSSDEVTQKAGGGGGAGGVLSGNFAARIGQTISVSVGSGNNNSSLDSLVAIAGGRGGDAPDGNGSSGGSGGGGAYSTGLGGAGTAGQGVDGQNASGGAPGTGGGASAASSITGAPLTYAVGGEFQTASDPLTATANTGNGGNGGSFIVTDYISVSGAGFSEYDGDYYAVGTYAASTMYRKTGTDKYIVALDGLTWAIVTLIDGSVTETAYYLNVMTMDDQGVPIPDTPPPQGPAVGYDSGFLPNPTVVRNAGLIAPQNGASGVVILAVQGNPASTVTGVATKDTTSRPGYSVYKFTFGSGSITFNA